MFGKPSLMTRVAVGKLIGLIVGATAFFILPFWVPDVSMMFRIALLLWYITFGAIIGVFGVFTYHPILKISMPWWLLAPFMGAWLNFLLSLFIYNKLTVMMITMLGTESFFQSPFWIVAEGAVVGCVIGYFATKYGGEGAETAGK